MFFFSSPACEWRMLLRTVGIYLAVTTAIRIFSFHASPAVKSAERCSFERNINAEGLQEGRLSDRDAAFPIRRRGNTKSIDRFSSVEARPAGADIIHRYQHRRHGH